MGINKRIRPDGYIDADINHHEGPYGSGAAVHDIVLKIIVNCQEVRFVSESHAFTRAEAEAIARVLDGKRISMSSDDWDGR